MTRRTTILATGSAVGAALLALSGCVETGRSATGAADTACPWEPDESITTTARIAYQNIPNGDLVVKDLGLLEACMPNATIEWSNFASGGDVVQAYGAGSVDIGLMGSSPATRALSEPLNIPLSVVWIHDVIGTAESLVVVDDKYFALAAIKSIGRNAVVAHERIELIARDAAEAAAGHTKTFELARIEATNDRLLADFANLGGFAGCEDGFHALNHPSP